MRAIQLNLWEWTESGPIPSTAAQQHAEAVTININAHAARTQARTRQQSAPSPTYISTAVCARETIDTTMTIDPCRHCPLKDICSPGECGALLFDINNDADYEQSFSSWLLD